MQTVLPTEVPKPGRSCRLYVSYIWVYGVYQLTFITDRSTSAFLSTLFSGLNEFVEHSAPPPNIALNDIVTVDE